MQELDNENNNKVFEINLLAKPQIIRKWIPRFFYGQTGWEIFSGRWKIKSPHKAICFGSPQLNTGENISLLGSSRWTKYTLQVKVKVLTESEKPPEGGVILYSHYKNFKNYYSFHFCHYKQKIEVIKRFRGDWSVIAENDFNLKTQKEYFITINADSGFQQCQIDGKNYVNVNDNGIRRGRIGIGTKYCEAEFSHVSISLF